jgi:phosphatidylglycerol lysyltransferase
MARDLVMAHGWSSTCYQILNPDIRYWFNRGRSAVVGYLQRGSYLLVAGAPVCALEALNDVIREFEAFALRDGLRVCYVCAEGRLRETLANSGDHSAVAIGAQPVWRPSDWAAIVAGRASLRAQLRRALNKGVMLEERDAREAARDPELHGVLHEWLACRRLPPLHFMTEPEVLKGVVDDRVVLVARRKGHPVAYLVASPVPARNGYLIEELARSPRAPNGTSELLIDAAMRRFGGEGRGFVTLGLVALAQSVFREENPWWLRGLMHFARAHANRFYNFRGLEHFRAKLHPACWENVYLISKEARFSPLTLYAVGGAFSGISPVRAIGLGILAAIRDEWRGSRYKRRE